MGEWNLSGFYRSWDLLKFSFFAELRVDLLSTSNFGIILNVVVSHCGNHPRGDLLALCCSLDRTHKLCASFTWREKELTCNMRRTPAKMLHKIGLHLKQ